MQAVVTPPPLIHYGNLDLRSYLSPLPPRFLSFRCFPLLLASSLIGGAGIIEGSLLNNTDNNIACITIYLMGILPPLS